MKCGTRPVTFYARAFKALCDQLHAIGRPVDETDKVHWFLRGLGTNFSAFSITHMAQTRLPCFSDLISKAESFEIFQKTLETLAPPVAAFTANKSSSHHRNNSFHQNHGRGYGSNSNSSHSGQSHTHTNQGRRPPRCHIFRLEGYYADRCKQGYDRYESTTFLAESDWLLDIGASAHMTPNNSILEQSTAYTGNECVIVRNGASLPITHTCNISHSPDLKLLDVLVVPHLTKNLFSISKLTNDFPLSVTFANNFFTVQNCLTGKVVAIDRRDGGSYVLERSNSALIFVLKNKYLHALYDLWHACLGHVNHSILALLNKKGQLHLTSLLPSPKLCDTCQLAKNHRLPYTCNEHKSSNVLDLIHCDI